MNDIYRIHLLIVSYLVVIFLSSCNKDLSKEDAGALKGDVTINFEHSVKNQPLTFNTEYTTNSGEPYSVKTFRYYVHDIKLVNTLGTSLLLTSDYFLIDESDPSSKTLTLKAPVDSYNAITFTLGVDSIDNVSGAQAGALDPAKGMFWTWSSGYVMAKLEGSSPVIVGPTNNFSYHIGGFKSPYAVIKYITLPIQSPYSLDLKKGSNINIHLNADINTWFSRVNPIELAINPACHAPGELAKKIADNYEGMFSIKNID